jgi:hypothetical protein
LRLRLSAEEFALHAQEARKFKASGIVSPQDGGTGRDRGGTSASQAVRTSTDGGAPHDTGLPSPAVAGSHAPAATAVVSGGMWAANGMQTPTVEACGGFGKVGGELRARGEGGRRGGGGLREGGDEGRQAGGGGAKERKEGAVLEEEGAKEQKEEDGAKERQRSLQCSVRQRRVEGTVKRRLKTYEGGELRRVQKEGTCGSGILRSRVGNGSRGRRQRDRRGRRAPSAAAPAAASCCFTAPRTDAERRQRADRWVFLNFVFWFFLGLFLPLQLMSVGRRL